MATNIVEFEKPKLKNPVFVEGLPGVGNVGRIAAGYIIEELGAKKFAELHSSHFMPFVLLHQSSAVHMLKNEFYYWKAKKKGQRDMIILIGDSQSIDPTGHYEIVNEILKYIEGFGVKEIFTLAGLNAGQPSKKPRIIGAVSHKELVKKYKKSKIDFDAGSQVGTIVGVAGLLLGMGRYYNMKGLCLLGETAGFPIIPDPKSAEEIIRILTKILGVKVSMAKLNKKIKEMEEFIKKIQNTEKQIMSQIIKQPPGQLGDEKDRLTYIG